MNGWEVLGWAGITSVSILIISVGAALARIFWQAADQCDKSTSILGSRKP